MNKILSLTTTRHRIQRLLLVAATGTTLILLAACGGSEPQTSAAPASTDGDSSSVAATDDRPADSTASDDSDTTADTTDAGESTVEVAEILTPAQQYLAEANTLFDAVTTTSDSVAAQLENADVESAAWRTKTADALRELAAVLDSAASLEAPADYATQHQALIDATSKYSWATEMLADGVETLDLNTINDAAALLANASLELTTAKTGLAG